MSTREELRDGIALLAKRSVGLMKVCSNEESTKLYLVLPLLGLLGYDYSNPYEVYPEHIADFDPRQPNKVDLAILKDGQPIIAIECKKVGADLVDARGQLRSYFNALPATKLAILTNGILFEFFVDSAESNVMDEEPFLTLDLEIVAQNGVSDDVLENLAQMTKATFSADTIAELAHVQLVKKRLRTAFVEEANVPSEDLCRLFLQKVGLRNVRKAALDRHYAPMIKTAFSEALVLPLAERLRAEGGDADGVRQAAQRIVTSERELSMFNYVRRRLAFLVADEAGFNAIESVGYKDYVGKFAVFYDRPQKGRLFDYIEGANGFDKFIFPEPYGEIVTNNILDIDEPLRAIFTARVREMGSRQMVRLAEIA
jgi:hypothetical protein